MASSSALNVEQIALFQRLKPLCVVVSDNALRVRPNTTANDLQRSLSSLHLALLAINDRTLLTPAMADYIFFPLSHILRRKDDWTDRILELTLACLRILLERAWSTRVPEQMFEQFCLMLVVITEGKGKGISEDVKAASVGCLVALFSSAKKSMESDLVLYQSIQGTKLRPLMGHVATVLLDVVRTEALLSLRLDAIQVLSLLYVSLLKNGDIVASFLPLTVSTISRCLSSSPSTANHKLLVSLLNFLNETLSLVMDDNLQSVSRPSQVGEMYHTEMTESWFRATKSQVKIALEGFFPFIRTHGHHLVREAIIKLSETLLIRCSRTLDVCQSLFLETILCLEHDPFQSTQDLARSALQHLHENDALKATIRDCIEASLYTWSLALPRTMTSNDDNTKINLLQRLTSAVDYLADDRSLILNFLETLLASIQEIAVFEHKATSSGLIQPSRTLQLNFHDDNSEPGALILQYSADDRVTSSLKSLLHAIGRTHFSGEIVDRLVLAASTNSQQNASNAWLALSILRGDRPSDEQVDELYSLAKSWLLEPDSSYSLPDIRHTVLISLDILAFAASTKPHCFRDYLIDILYPTLSLLSHPSPQIQSAARQTLDTIATATGYNDLQTLILENTDYLVNSIALKLNIFDVSVQVLATLYTVTRLAGPRIVPYFDDVWGSLFDVVDRFHGYERLVTGVFAVMTGIVDAIATSIQFSSSSSSMERKNTKHETACEEIKCLIETIQKDEDQLPPKREIEVALKQPPLPEKTASLLQTLARKSALLTSHPSPHVRFNLIHLLRKALPLLSIPATVKEGEQDTFLPLLAQEVWPAICSKLLDTESWVVNAALEAVTTLMSIEGDFFGSKVEKDVLPALKKILALPKVPHVKTMKEVVVFEKEAAIKAIIAIVTHSDQKPVVFDDMLELTWPWIKQGGSQSEELENAFESKNGDAVWLIKQIDSGRASV